MPKDIDPDLKKAYDALIEERKKLADPRRFYTRSDQLYPDRQFRPDYVDPSMEQPVYQGMLPGGAQESDISPLDFISEVPALAKGALKGFPALVGMIKKKATPDLPSDMSLLDRIKLAAKRSGVKAPEMEAAQAEREALRNQPKDYFDKARQKDTQRIFDENAKSIQELEKKKLAEKAASEYQVPGQWQKGSYSRVTEELPIEFLSQYKGNTLGKTDLEALKKSIQEQGLDEPLILSFDPETSKIKLGEGNHRLEALRQLGYTNAPVRGYRSSIDDVSERLLGPEFAEFKKVPLKPSTDKIDPSYYPADMKPSDLIDFEALKRLLNKKSTDKD